MELAARPIDFVAIRVRTQWLIPVALFFLGVVLYSHASGYELMYSWDDNRYISENFFLRDFSVNGVVKIFTNAYFAAYIPVTIFAYWIQYQLWGMNPMGYHVVDVLLNAVNGALVYLFLLRLLKNRNVALMAALLWIVHPLQVESVVWVAELKSVLSMLFTLLAFIVYIRSAEEDAPRWSLGLAYFLYLLAVLSKPSVVGVPFLFMIYDYFWARMNIRRVLKRGIVPLIIGAAGAVGILVTHGSYGGIKNYWGGSPLTSGMLMLMVYWDYVIAFIAPWTLNNFYQYTAPAALSNNPVSIILGIGLVIGAIYVVWKQPFGKPFSLFAVLWIVLFMLPVSNIVPIAIERADRYMYYPSVVIFAAVAIVIDRAWRRWNTPTARYAIAAAFAAVVVVFAGFTFSRSLAWQNEGVLWRDHLEGYPKSGTGWLNLGVYYYNKQNFEQAIPVFQQLLALNPTDFKGNRFLGHIALAQQRNADAIPFYRTALKTRPNDASTHSTLALAYFRLSAYTEAIAEYRAAIKLDSSMTQAYANLGTAALRNDEYKLAQQAFGVVVQRRPEDASAHNALALAYFEGGDFENAVKAYTAAVRLDSSLTKSFANLGTAALRTRQYPLAEQSLKVAVTRDPADANSSSDLCSALVQLNRIDEAIGYCQTAIELQPRNGLYVGRLASIYLDLSQPDKALPIAQQAVTVAPNMTLSYRVLGEAYADLGDTQNALKALERALQLDPTNARAKQVLESLTATP